MKLYELAELASFYSQTTDWKYIRLAQALDRYQQLEHVIKELSGYNLECLKDLFAMGYTLERSNYEMTMTELAKLIDEE